MSDFFVQLGWCGPKEYNYLLGIQLLAALVLIGLAIGVDLFLRKLAEPRIKWSTEVEMEVGEYVYYRRAVLKVHNKSRSVSITKCTAFLEDAVTVDRKYGIERGGYLKWKDTGKCEIPIGDYPQTLNVAENKAGDVNFCFCEDQYSKGFPMLYIVTIRLEWTFGNNQMRHKIFKGYLYTTGKQEFIEADVYHNKNVFPMIFEEGDWMKDKHIPKSQNRTAKMPSKPSGV